jgi:hypothetical protein
VIDTYDELLKFWKLLRNSFVMGDIRKPMYYYLSLCLVVVGGLYMYLVWEGFFALAILFSRFAGITPPAGLPPISLVGSVGIVLIIRYSIFGAVDGLAKAPKALEERMALLEDKVNDLHRLAFGEVDDAEEKAKATSVIVGKGKTISSTKTIVCESKKAGDRHAR